MNKPAFRRCKHCYQEKLISEFHVYDKTTGARRHECIPCYRVRMNASYRKNREKRLANARANYAKNPSSKWTPERRARANERAREDRKQYLQFILNHYGARCACCGEVEPMFLTIDHVNNDGNVKRAEQGVSTRLYKWIVKNGFPDDFQVLCYNCNCGKHRNGGICPHMEGSTTRA